jgi:hypothetical protein
MRDRFADREHEEERADELDRQALWQLRLHLEYLRGDVERGDRIRDDG